MTWDAQHRREDALKAVTAWADTRRDGILPTHLPEVTAAFTDETELVSALVMRWHTRLNGRIERELMDQGTDPEDAVVMAWRKTATDLPGIRAILDRAGVAPPSEGVREVVARAERKDRVMLAAMASRAGVVDPDAVEAGHEIEARARGAAGLVA